MAVLSLMDRAGGCVNDGRLTGLIDGGDETQPMPLVDIAVGETIDAIDC